MGALVGRRVVVALVVGLGALALAPVAATWADTGSSGAVQAVLAEILTNPARYCDRTSEAGH